MVPLASIAKIIIFTWRKVFGCTQKYLSLSGIFKILFKFVYVFDWPKYFRYIKKFLRAFMGFVFTSKKIKATPK